MLIEMFAGICEQACEASLPKSSGASVLGCMEITGGESMEGSGGESLSEQSSAALCQPYC